MSWLCAVYIPSFRSLSVEKMYFIYHEVVRPSLGVVSGRGAQVGINNNVNPQRGVFSIYLLLLLGWGLARQSVDSTTERGWWGPWLIVFQQPGDEKLAARKKRNRRNEYICEIVSWHRIHTKINCWQGADFGTASQKMKHVTRTKLRSFARTQSQESTTTFQLTLSLCCWSVHRHFSTNPPSPFGCNASQPLLTTSSNIFISAQSRGEPKHNM